MIHYLEEHETPPTAAHKRAAAAGEAAGLSLLPEHPEGPFSLRWVLVGALQSKNSQIRLGRELDTPETASPGRPNFFCLPLHRRAAQSDRGVIPGACS